MVRKKSFLMKSSMEELLTEICLLNIIQYFLIFTIVEFLCELVSIGILEVWNLFWYWGFDNELVAEHSPSIVILR